MTTVVYRDGRVAADSLVVRDSTVLPEEFAKVTRIANDVVVAFVGSPAAFERAVERMSYGGDPDIQDETLVLEFNGEKIFEHSHEGTVQVCPTHGYYAWGTGRDIALGALSTGATAVEAVVAAAKFDAFTDGTIREMRVVNERSHENG